MFAVRFLWYRTTSWSWFPVGLTFESWHVSVMAAAKVKARINPDLIVWARESANLSLDEAADRLKIERDDLSAWEAGFEQPSVPQLRRLADLYKRPLAVLYLPQRPTSFLPMRDFRRVQGADERRFSPELTLEIRLANQRRTLAVEMYEESGETPSLLPISFDLETNPETAGEIIRRALKVGFSDQAKWKETRVAYKAWRSRIEGLGVLVFEMTRVESEEASGFASWHDILPFIAVNGKDHHSKRVYSLLHELVHLAVRKSGVSDIREIDYGTSQKQAIEVFCNAVAAAALMPKADLLSDEVVRSHERTSLVWQDQEISELAKRFSVSREAILRRLLTFGRTSEAFYSAKRAQYSSEFLENQRRQREASKGKPIPRNMPRETVARFGGKLVRKILENYYNDRITLSDVSGMLGVKVRHVNGIAEQVGFSE